jgi:hypothetical protein
MRVVLSLTTIPGRERFVVRALESLRAQTYRSDAIYLWLPKGYSPGHLSEVLAGIRGLRVASCEDLGPATKLLPTLSEECDPETAIITLDDDIEYPPSLVHKLVQGALLHPEAAIGFTGWQVVAYSPEVKVRHFDDAFSECAMFQPVHVLEGFKGVLYRRSFFGADLMGHLRALDAFRFHDDILFSGYLASRGIRRLARWYGVESPQTATPWKLHCNESGLHVTPGWRRLGELCCDYFRSAFAMDTHIHAGYEPAERLQLNADSGARQGFSHHSCSRAQSKPAGTVSADLFRFPWPWADGHFKEVLARSGVPADERACDWLLECARITESGGTVKITWPLSAGSWLKRLYGWKGRFTLEELCTDDYDSAAIRSGVRDRSVYDSPAVIECDGDRLSLILVRQ